MSTQPKQYYVRKPIFEGQRNGVIECQVEGCHWHCAGLRPMLKDAWNEHYRMNHSQQVGAMLIHRDMRQAIWLPTQTRS